MNSACNPMGGVPVVTIHIGRAPRVPGPPGHSLAFKRRGFIGGMVLVPLMFVSFCSRPLVRHGTLLDHAFDALAWTFLLMCFVLRVWSTLYIGDRKEEQLQTEGPYSMTRNPLYFGSCCFALSAALFFKSVTLVAAVADLAAIYAQLVIRSEERGLEWKFAEDFREYCARTPRLFPNPRLYRASDSVTVRIAGLRRELKRLLRLALLPFGALLVAHLRAQPWWPFWFHLP